MRWYNLNPTTELAGVGIVTKQNATKGRWRIYEHKKIAFRKR